jgi:hypothetical protein
MNLRTPAALLLVLATTVGCESFGGINSVLQQVSGFSTDVNDWVKALPDAFGQTELDQLSTFSDKAGALLGTLQRAAEQNDKTTQDAVVPILASLIKLSGVNVDALENLGNDQKSAAANAFGNEAANLGAIVKDVLSRGLPGLGS